MREITYPHPAENISQGNLALESTFQFLSVYRTKEQTKAAQMISSFESFDKNVWTLSLMTLIVGYFILCCSHICSRKMLQVDRKINRQHKHRYTGGKNYLYEVACHMGARDSLSD